MLWLQAFFSSILFALPVFVTVGLYLGINFTQISQCGLNCHNNTGTNPYGPGGLPGGGGTDGIYCQKSYAITPGPGRYIFNPNQWGDINDTGKLCIQFTTSADGRPQDYAPGWSTTWQYPQSPDPELPVHAFANAQLKEDSLPAQLSNINDMNMDVVWSYAPGDATKQRVDYPGVALAQLNANVCIDMFLSADAGDSSDTKEAQYEVMIWFGRFGLSTDPVGFLDGALTERTIDGNTFTLYGGVNGLGQQTLTWLADKNVTSFSGSVYPLMSNLATYNGPAGTDYLGYLAFGTEALYSVGNVTFYNPKLELDIQTS